MVEAVVSEQLTRAERLRGVVRVQRLMTEGVSGFIYPFRFVYKICDMTHCADSEVVAAYVGGVATQVALLFSVPKRKHKRASSRNQLRRRMKEAYRLNKYRWLGAHETAATSTNSTNAPLSQAAQRLEIALIYSVTDELNYKTIDRAIQKIISHISRELQ